MHLGNAFNIRQWSLSYSLSLLGSLLLFNTASAQDIIVLSAGAPKHALVKLAASYQKQSGNQVHFTFGSAGLIKEHLKDGQARDIIVLTREGIDGLERQGRLVAQTRQDLGSVPVGVAVRQDVPLPDISTETAFKQTLLRSNQVVYGDPARASTATYFVQLLDKLGLAQMVETKSRIFRDGYGVLGYLATSHAPGVIGITQKSEILSYADRGIRYAGPFPGRFYHATTYTAAVMHGAAHADAATDFLRFLKSPEAHKVFQSTGFD